VHLHRAWREATRRLSNGWIPFVIERSEKKRQLLNLRVLFIMCKPVFSKKEFFICVAINASCRFCRRRTYSTISRVDFLASVNAPLGHIKRTNLSKTSGKLNLSIHFLVTIEYLHIICIYHYPFNNVWLLYTILHRCDFMMPEPLRRVYRRNIVPGSRGEERRIKKTGVT